MNGTDLLALGEALSRTAEVVGHHERIPFRDYLSRIFNDGDGQIASLFGDGAFSLRVDGELVEGPGSAVPVTAASRVVLYRRQGPFLDVASGALVRRICLN